MMKCGKAEKLDGIAAVFHEARGGHGGMVRMSLNVRITFVIVAEPGRGDIHCAFIWVKVKNIMQIIGD